MAQRFPAAALKQVAARLNNGFSCPPVAINRSCSLTIINRYSKYRKHPFIGDEIFHFVSVWPGKSGQLIFRFRPKVPSSDYRFMEIGQDKLAEIVPELDEKLTAFLGEPVNIYLKMYSEHYQEQERLEQEAEQYAKEEATKATYGRNWGLFG